MAYMLGDREVPFDTEVTLQYKSSRGGTRTFHSHIRDETYLETLSMTMFQVPIAELDEAAKGVLEAYGKFGHIIDPIVRELDFFAASHALLQACKGMVDPRTVNRGKCRDYAICLVETIEQNFQKRVKVI